MSARTARSPHLRRAATCALAFAGIVGIAACSSGSSSDGDAGDAAPASTKRTVTAVATGTAEGVPDTITARVSVSTRGETAAGVLADTSTRMQQLLDQLAEAGIDPKDVQTTSVGLGPTYDRDGNITGYSADNSLQVTLRDLETAGTQLDAMVETVGDAGRIDGISLGFADDSELRSKARADAVVQARAHAEEMAAAAGAEVGDVRTIVEIDATEGYPIALTAAADGGSVPIAAGSQEVTVKVEAVFSLT